jgi:NAD(P)-dependent dehydrogenase (short-subunit alcohol dehydrogenase family)
MAKAERKVVVITGATRGLGRAMVDEFIWHGHTVLGCGRSEERVEALCKAYGPPHHFAVVDVTDDAAVKDWTIRCLEHAGAPDLLLNNAAVINRSAPLWGISAEEFSQVIDINIKGVTNVIRHFVPDMMERGRGVIVNWSSGWGRSTSPEVAPYCATKWAIEGLTQALAQELPEGLSAVALNPGIINTEMLRSCFGGSSDSYPSPDEWAKQAVPYLLNIGTQHNGQQLSAPGVHD